MTITISSLLDDYPNPFFLVDPICHDGIPDDFEYVYVNQAFSVFLGIPVAELIGRRFRQCFQLPGEPQWLNLFAEISQNAKHVYVDQISDILQRKLFTEAFHVEPGLCACIIHDFTAVPDAVLDSETVELRRRANSDCLTGFYNRFYLRELHNTLQNTTDLGVTYLDINNLKAINDTYGHSAGDARILEIADLIRRHYADSQVFRVGGDEFVMLTAGLTREAFLALSADAHAAFSKDGLASIGYAFFDRVDDLQTCIAQCDDLMYTEKRRTKNTHI